MEWKNVSGRRSNVSPNFFVPVCIGARRFSCWWQPAPAGWRLRALVTRGSGGFLLVYVWNRSRRDGSARFALLILLSTHAWETFLPAAFFALFEHYVPLLYSFVHRNQRISLVIKKFINVNNNLYNEFTFYYFKSVIHSPQWIDN